MTKIESLHRIKEIIKNEEKCIISLVGKNTSFKTELLKEINVNYSNDKNFNVLFLKAETTFLNETKEKQSDIQFIGEIRKFINTFLSKKINIIDDQLKKTIKEATSFLDNLKKDNHNDEYLKNEIFNSFKLDENLIENKINIEILPNEKNSIKNYSSGQGMYSLLKFCSLVINHSIEKHKDNKKIIEKKTILIIDEPEKHCHKSLIKKIASIMYQLYNLKVIIIFSTHSDYLLNEFISKFRNNNKSNFYLLNHNKPFNDDANIEEVKNLIDNINENIWNKKSLNSREQQIIISSFFDENLFLVEGLKDYEFVNCLMTSNKLNQYYYSIYDCGRKTNVKKLNAIIKNLNPNKNIFCFVDRDNDPEIKEDNFYEFIPDLETEINDKNKKDKNNIEFYKCENIKNVSLFKELINNKLIYFFEKEKKSD